MSLVSRMDHRCSTKAKKAYTTYTWRLEDWRLFYDNYLINIDSPEFIVAGPPLGCTCTMTLRPNGKVGIVQIDFRSPSLQFHIIHITISVVDEKMKKLLIAKKKYYKSLPNCQAEVQFGIPFTESSMKKYLQRDDLILFFELTHVAKVENSFVNTDGFTANFSVDLCEKLDEMYLGDVFYDVTFIVENDIIRAHKIILAANSRVFKAMFTTEMKEQEQGKVTITDAEFWPFTVFLRYMYKGQVIDMDKVVDKLIVLADKYEVKNLKELCENFMIAHLEIRNAILYLVIAHKICCSMLEKKAVCFVRQKIHALTKSSVRKELSNYPSLMEKVFQKSAGSIR